MADAAVATPGTSADVVFRLTRSEGTVDIANNRSFLSVACYLLVTAANGAGGPFRTSPADSNGYVTSSQLGTLVNVTKGYDLRPASSLPSILWGTWEGWVDHDPDGKKTINFSFGFSGGGSTPLSTASGSDSIVLTPIPRGPLVKVAGVWKRSIAYVKHAGTWKVAIPYVKDAGTWKVVS